MKSNPVQTVYIVPYGVLSRIQKSIINHIWLVILFLTKSRICVLCFLRGETRSSSRQYLKENQMLTSLVFIEDEQSKLDIQSGNFLAKKKISQKKRCQKFLWSVVVICILFMSVFPVITHDMNPMTDLPKIFIRILGLNYRNVVSLV